jgi:hypothetical protein
MIIKNKTSLSVSLQINQNEVRIVLQQKVHFPASLRNASVKGVAGFDPCFPGILGNAPTHTNSTT